MQIQQRDQEAENLTVEPVSWKQTSSTTPSDESAPVVATEIKSPAAGTAELFSTIIREAWLGATERAAGWHPNAHLAPSQMWLSMQNEQQPIPHQGWKLHISASVSSAEVVLRRALPVLLREQASFKLIASLQQLASLNESVGGLSQVGKFITVYPGDDAQAVRLAVALDQATRGLAGPPILSDRPLTSESVVYYRYGSFQNQLMQTALGEVVQALVRPDGARVPDRRGTTYQSPDWAVDPFVAAGVAAPLASPKLLIAGRYLLLNTLSRTARGLIHIAVDTVEPRRCILKRAIRKGTEARDGGDACDRLRHEFDMLSRLAPDLRFPRPFDLVEQDGDLFLVMEDVEGETLERYIGRSLARGSLIPPSQIVAWGCALATTLADVHARGIIYRDLKSPNVIVTPEQQLRLIDFEIAYDVAGQRPPDKRGTRGYQAPKSSQPTIPTVADDIYALGALLYLMATGAEPAVAPDPFRLLERPIGLLNPSIAPALVAVIARCLDPDPAARFASMEALDVALRTLDVIAQAVPALGGEVFVETDPSARTAYVTLTRRLGDTICAVAQPMPSSQGVLWASTHRTSQGTYSRDLNTGSAGTVLALSDIVAAWDDPLHRTTLAAGATGLRHAARLEGAPLPGLYVGEAGVAAALLRAGQILGDEALINEAAHRSRWIATLPYASPDLFNGTAGRLRLHVWMWDATADSEHLRYAIDAGEVLLAAAEDASDGGLRWHIPPGYDRLSGHAYLGYAHGAAGIADTLLDLFEVTGDERYRDAAARAGRWLTRLAVPVLEDEQGLNWPAIEGQPVSRATFWCHGAAGIGLFFCRAAALDLLPDAAILAAGAAYTVARGARWSGPTQCHGLAGNIEFLLDMFQATADPTYLTEAQSLGRLLQAFCVEQNGQLVCSSESPVIYTPDYMVGYAGVAVTLLRLSDPELQSGLLSRRGFRR